MKMWKPMSAAVVLGLVLTGSASESLQRHSFVESHVAAASAVESAPIQTNPLLPAPEAVALARRGMPASCTASSVEKLQFSDGPAVSLGGFTTDWLGYQMWYLQYFGNYAGGMTEAALETLPKSTTLSLCWYVGNFTDDGGDRQLHQHSVIVLGNQADGSYGMTYSSPARSLPLAAPPVPGSTQVSQLVSAISQRFAQVDKAAARSQD